ncbi:MAG: InlB B-repeat-containing protein [Erysipelotrichaceae bacterium]
MSFRSTVTHAFDSGDGTSANPYVIKTPGELDDISDEMDACYVLGNDIYMNSYDWAPLGSGSYPFTGVLDGAGYSIWNLTSRTELINYIEYAPAYTMALFSFIADDAEVYNLGLNLNFVLDPTVDSSLGGIVVGGLAGLVYGSDVSIHDIWISGLISVEASNDGFYFALVGGLIGESYNQYDISGISFTGDIHVGISSVEEVAIGGLIGFAENTAISQARIYDTNFTIETEPSNEGSVGGLVGYMEVNDSYFHDESIANISKSVIDNLEINTGIYMISGGLIGKMENYSSTEILIDENLVKDSTFGDGSYYTGGLVGYALENILFQRNQVESVSIGSADAEGNEGKLGGIAGYSRLNDFDENRVTGLSITGTENTYSIGGVAGAFESGYIDHTYVEGTIISGSNMVGGFVGEADAIEISNSSFNGSLTGKSRVGGLIGYTFNNELVISQCWTLGTITATDQFAGGLIGLSENNVKVLIQNSYSLADVSGSDYVGGLVGTITYSLSIEHSYFGGTVSGDTCVDAIIPSTYDPYTTITLVYFDEVNGLSDYGVAVSTADLKSATSVVGLAFDAQDQTTDSSLESPWFVNEFTNDGYLGVTAERSVISYTSQSKLIGLQLTWGEIVTEKQKVLYKINPYYLSSDNPNIDYSLYWGILAEEPSDPSRADYVFGGWYSDAEFTTPWVFSDGNDGDLALYAKWTSGIPDTSDASIAYWYMMGLGFVALLSSKPKKA